MYSLPSTSRMSAPLACSTKKGSPPTFLNARTGELTPPGNLACARLKSWWLLFPIIPCELTFEVIVRCVRDPHTHDVARLDAARLIDRDDAVHFQRLSLRASDRDSGIRGLVYDRFLH